ncbi:hypothetical protein RFI_21855, partial [Reticulomyxa filosa]
IVLLHSTKISAEQMHLVITCFQDSHQFAREFNQAIDWRTHIWSKGKKKKKRGTFKKKKKGGSVEVQKNLPDLYYQEAKSSGVILEVFLTLCTQYVPSSFATEINGELKTLIFEKHRSLNIWNRFYQFGNQLLKDYVFDCTQQCNSDTPLATNESIPWKSAVVLLLLDSLLNDQCITDNVQRMQILRKLYDNVVKCVEVENKDIRKRIVTLFSRFFRPFISQSVKVSGL